MATKKNGLIGKTVVVRATDAGVFYGKLESVEPTIAGTVVVVNDCRRIWAWSGAASLSQLAMEGVKNPENCKFAMKTQGHCVLDVIELIPVTSEALKNLDAVKDWKI